MPSVLSFRAQRCASRCTSRLGRGRGVRRLVVTHRLLLERRRHEQPSLLDAIAIFALDQALGPSKPTPRRADLPSDREVHPDHERGAPPFAGIQIYVVGTLQTVC